MNTQEYFAEGISSIDDVEEQYGPVRDATTLSKIADCARKHEIRVEENLTRSGQKSAKMIAGIAVHEGLDYYYSHVERDADVEAQSIKIIRDEWDSWGIDRALMQQNETHLSADSLEEVTRNYFHYWNYEAIEIYRPVSGLKIEDLDLSRVLAAKFKLNDQDSIILGESSLVMLFDIEGEPFVYAGKPDLPVKTRDGRLYVMDHKTTSSYLSDWWAKSHEVSNKLRGYMAMVNSLMNEECNGGVINGIYVGKHATNPNSKATKFQRFKFDFTTAHAEEALKNQWALTKTIDFYRDELGYFPQSCGFGGCAAPDICRADPPTRAETKMRDWEQSDRTFWDL